MTASARAVEVDPLEARPRVFHHLETATRAHGPAELAVALAELRGFLASDLAGIEADLEALELGSTGMHASAGHLLALGGKRLRPACVALAARLGGGFGPAARDLAVAAELVHSATLLHDDVVDVGERRRGAPAARVLYGNAASIFAGDWLLVEALLRVRRTRLDDVLDRALAVLTEMLEAEALQLERRGRLDGSLDDYLRVIHGKTASLFRWALFAGARAGGLDATSCGLLQTFGERLGVAFQLTDDLLDLDGDPALLGKEILSDLAEGKATYPLLVALGERPALRDQLAAALASPDGLSPEVARRVVSALGETGALEETRRCAASLIALADHDLAELAEREGPRAAPAIGALATVARSAVTRRS